MVELLYMLLLKIIYTLVTITSVAVTFWYILELLYKEDLPLKKFLLKIFVAGSIYFSITLSWILTSYPLNDFGLGRSEGLVFLVIFFLITVHTSGSAFLLFYFLKLFIWGVIRKLKLRKIFLRTLEALAFGLFVVCISYLMSLILYFIFYSPNFAFGWYCIFGAPSLSFVFTPLIYFYQYIGLAGVDFIIGTSIAIIYFLNRRVQLIVLIIFIFTCLGWILFFTNDSNTLIMKETQKVNNKFGENILVISTKKHGERTSLAVVDDVLSKTSAKNTIFLMPEGVSLSEQAKQRIDEVDGTALYGQPYLMDNLLYNALFFHSADSYYSKRVTEKRYLVQNGEYVPNLFKFILQLTNGDQIANSLFQNGEFKSGRGLQEIIIKGKTYIVGLCSDFWSREGIAFSKNSQARSAIIFESNSRFHSNKWYLINLYAWHTLYAKTSRKDLLSVPNDSPIWEIYFTK
jgi:hypothetical protein